MEKEILKLIQPYFADRPDTFVIILSIVVITRYLRKYIDEHAKEIRGWLSRHDGEFEKRDRKYDKLIMNTQDRIIKLIEKVNYLKGVIDERNRKKDR